MSLFSNEYQRTPLGYDAYAVSLRNLREAREGRMNRSPITEFNVNPGSRLVVRSNVPGNVSFQIVSERDGRVINDYVSDSQIPILLDEQDRIYDTRLVSEALVRKPLFYVGLTVLAAIGIELYRRRARR